MSKKINEATSTDLPIIQKLVNEYGWEADDTLLYQQIYNISENLIKDYDNLKNIRSDIVLQDLNSEVIAIIENNLDKESKNFGILTLRAGLVSSDSRLISCFIINNTTIRKYFL